MGNLQVPTGNQVLDLGIISRMTTAINELQDDVQTKNAKVYTGTNTPPADTQTNRLAIVTNYTTATSDNKTGLDVISKTIVFGKTFSTEPVVTVTPVLEGFTTASTPDVTVVITKTSVSDVTVAIRFDSKLLKQSIGINVIAIGVL